MRIASVNLNKGLLGPRQSLALSWLEQVTPDLVLLQEPFAHHRSAPETLGRWTRLAGNHFVAAYASEPARAELRTDRWLRVHAEGIVVDNVYLPHERKRERQSLIESLSTAPADTRAILGDFNMAPRPEDGRYGEEESQWTGVGERQALAHLLQSQELVDLGAHQTLEFTFERTNRGQRTRFRCDLALVSRGLQNSASMCIDHSVRASTPVFTDHSALILDLVP